MGSWKSCLGAVLLLALVDAPVSAEEDRRTRLDKGEVIVEAHAVPGNDLPEAVVAAVIDAPPEHVWQIIDRCGDYMHTMVRMKYSRELSRVGDIVRCESLIDMPWPMRALHAITVAKHTVEAGRWTRAWKLESGDYKVNQGSWVLTPWGQNKTLAEYRMLSSPNVSIPDFIQGMAMKVALPDMIAKIRSEVR
jgi:hypothetical protein